MVVLELVTLMELLDGHRYKQHQLVGLLMEILEEELKEMLIMVEAEVVVLVLLVTVLQVHPTIHKVELVV